MLRLGVLLIAVIHIGLAVLEIGFWDWAAGRLAVYIPDGLPAEGQPGWPMIAALLMNQGIYNAFLAAGLLWGVARWDDDGFARQLATFLLACVMVAGLFGYLTAGQNPVFLAQLVPAAIVLAALLMNGRRTHASA